MGKSLLFGALASALGLGVMWALNINIAAWVGSWISPQDAQSAGLSLMGFLGLAGALLYMRTLGTQFGGHGAVRGLIFGAILAAIMIWAVPVLVRAAGVATGDTRAVYQGDGESNSYAASGGDVKTKEYAVGDAPPLFGVKPPLAEMTAGKKWTSPDDWEGRLLPFLIGFCVYGLVLGLALSEDPHK